MCEPREGEPSKPDDLSFVLYRPGETAKTAASRGPEG